MMSPKLCEIFDVLEELAPKRLAEDWDNPGLQVGRTSQQVDKIFVALDPTLQAVKEASDRKAQLLLTHHPLIFKPLYHLDLTVSPSNILLEAIKREITIFSAHTNLDIAKGGINDLLAGLFNLQEIKVLQKMDDSEFPDVGLGRVGRLPEPLRLVHFVERVKEKLGLRHLKVVGDKNRWINHIAVVGGSGGNLVPEASKADVDLLLTGDVGHHHALEAENLGLALIDGGHFHTEKRALSLFSDRLGDILAGKGFDITIENYQNERCPTQCGSL